MGRRVLLIFKLKQRAVFAVYLVLGNEVRDFMNYFECSERVIGRPVEKIDCLVDLFFALIDITGVGIINFEQQLSFLRGVDLIEVFSAVAEGKKKYFYYFII